MALKQSLFFITLLLGRPAAESFAAARTTVRLAITAPSAGASVQASFVLAGTCASGSVDVSGELVNPGTASCLSTKTFSYSVLLTGTTGNRTITAKQGKSVVSRSFSYTAPVISEPPPTSPSPIVTTRVGTDAYVIPDQAEAPIGPQGTNYFVSPNGVDTAAGSESAPFKTVQKAVSLAQPGTSIVLRAGEYNEKVSLTVNGTAEQPIIIRNYPGEKAVLNGAKSLAQFSLSKVTALAAEMGPVPNLTNVYRAVIPASEAPVGDLELVDGARLMRLAQYPNRPNDLYMKGVDFAQLTEGNGIATAIFNTFFDYRADNYWLGEYVSSSGEVVRYRPRVAVWSHPGNNEIFEREVASSFANQVNLLTALTHPIAVNLTDLSRTDGFALLNHPAVLDQDGEYIWYRNGSGQVVVYFRPYQLSADQVAFVKHATAIIPSAVGKGNHVHIKGLTVKNYGAKANTRAGGVMYPATFTNTGVKVYKCVFENIIGSAVSIFDGTGPWVEKVSITKVKGSRGIQFGSTVNGRAYDNVVDETERTSIYTAGSRNTVFAGNEVGRQGLHGNGITAYQYGDGVLMYRNIVKSENIGITLQNTANISLVGNIVYTTANKAIASWGGGSGYLHAINNIAYSNSTSSLALSIGSTDAYSSCMAYNNIVSGGLSGCAVRASNVYTGLAWNEKSTYNWSFGPGEQLVSDKALLFSNFSALDFRPPQNSILKDLGSDVIPVIDQLRYPDVNMLRDLQNVDRTLGPIDIGPYESVN